MVFLLAVVFSFGVPWADAGDYDVALGTLPLVTAVDYTTDGRIQLLEGELSHPNALDPIIIATAFVSNRSDLYPRAPGSTFIVETRVATEDPVTISVIQIVEGYPATDVPINVGINSAGVVTSVSGSGLRLSDLPSLEKAPMSEEDALKTGRGALGVDQEVFFQSARLVLRGTTNLKPAWRCTIYFHHAPRNIDVQAILDVHAFSGEIIDHSLANVTGFVDHLTPPTTRPANPGPLVGCIDLFPSIGDFTDKPTFEQWLPSNLGDGSIKEDVNGMVVFANSVDPPCAYEPGSPCNAGAVTRSGLTLPPGLSTARLLIFSPACTNKTEQQMSLRWGPAENQVYEIDVTDLCDIKSYEFDIPLSSKPSWKSEDVTALTIELDYGLKSVTLVSLDLRAGPWVTLSDPPTVTTTYGSGLTAGVPVKIEQMINNLGCALPSAMGSVPHGSVIPQMTYPNQRQLRIRKHRMIELSQGWQLDPSSDWEPVAAPRLMFEIPAETEDLPVEFAAGPGNTEITFDAGHWLVEITHPNHDGGTTYTEIDVEPAPIPDVGISNMDPAEFSKGSGYLGYNYRIDTLNTVNCESENTDAEYRTRALFGTYTATTDSGIRPSAGAEVYLRPHDPHNPITQCPPSDQANWILMGEVAESQIDEQHEWTVIFRTGACPDLWNTITDWDLLDLWINVVDVDGEINTSNNSLCVNRWIPAARAPDFNTAIGDTLVASTFFSSDTTVHPSASPGVYNVHIETDGHSENPNSGTLRYQVELTTEPFSYLAWALDETANDGKLASAAMIRYRREYSGVNGLPHLGGGANEVVNLDDSIDHGMDELFEEGPHRVYLDASNQWQTAIWRRGALGPFGEVEGFANFATNPDGSDGQVIGALFHPDSLPCPNDRQRETCIGYPTVYIDGIWIWRSPRPTQPAPEIETSGLWYEVIPEGSTTPEWVPFPERLPGPAPVNLAVGATNSGDANFGGTLSGTISIDEARVSLSGSTSVGSLPPGGTVLIPMGTAWAATPGSYTVSGQVLGTSNSVTLPLDVYTPIDITMNRVEYKTMSGEWVDLASAPAFPREYPVELAVIVHNTGTDAAHGFLDILGSVLQPTDPPTDPPTYVLLQNLAFQLMVSIPGKSGEEPGETTAYLSPDWLPADGQSTLSFGGLFNDEAIGGLTYNGTADGCPVPLVIVP
jgi:hypothetical protein